ncbi:unnamed protein product [Amoebophrya sp. A120]|nr:unnamed protein product [Amoebophrya sp. A120]|eukprot:GSA120T00017640001.1
MAFPLDPICLRNMESAPPSVLLCPRVNERRGVLLVALTLGETPAPRLLPTPGDVQGPLRSFAIPGPARRHGGAAVFAEDARTPCAGSGARSSFCGGWRGAPQPLQSRRGLPQPLQSRRLRPRPLVRIGRQLLCSTNSARPCLSVSGGRKPGRALLLFMQIGGRLAARPIVPPGPLCG